MAFEPAQHAGRGAAHLHEEFADRREIEHRIEGGDLEHADIGHAEHARDESRSPASAASNCSPSGRARAARSPPKPAGPADIWRSDARTTLATPAKIRTSRVVRRPICEQSFFTQSCKIRQAWCDTSAEPLTGRPRRTRCRASRGWRSRRRAYGCGRGNPSPGDGRNPAPQLAAIGLVGAVGDEIDAELALRGLDRAIDFARRHVEAFGIRA